MITASTNPSTNEIIEESNYYPFGLKHKGYNNVTTSNRNSTAQKFGYNGKELNEELGLEWHDFGARNYNAALGRWMNIDPLSEADQRPFSPYHYVKNNPIKFIDPNGMIWKDPQEAEELKNRIIEKISSLEERKTELESRLNEEGISDRRKKRLKRRIARITSRTKSLDNSFANINAIAEDDRIFDLVGVNNNQNEAHVRMGDDGVINIQGSNDAIHIHEMSHVAQSLNSKRGLRFSERGFLLSTTRYGIKDEILGYRAQFGFDPDSLTQSVSSIYDINTEYVANLRNSNDELVYPVIYRVWLQNKRSLERMTRGN